MSDRVLAIALMLCAAVHGIAAEAITLTGQKHQGELIAITGQDVTLKTEAGDVSVPIAQLLSIDIGPVGEREKFSEVELVDGSVFFVNSLAIKGDRCEMRTLANATVQVPLAGVATILRDAHETATKQQWLALIRKRGPLDLLVVRSEGKLDALEGTAGIGNAEGDAIEFSPSGSDQKVNTKLSRAQGFVFVRKPDPNAQPALCKIIDATGNTVSARTVRLDGPAIVVESVAGATLTYPAMKSLSRFDFSKGKLTYLSDLDPIEKDETSTEDLVFPHRRDRNLYGGPLRMKNVPYSKGLAMHSRTLLTYDIGGDYRELRAMLGVDDAVRTESGAPVRAVVIIEGDGRELFKGEIQSRDDPKPLALDVKGIRRLRLTVTSSGLDLGNQVNFCDARVTK